MSHNEIYKRKSSDLTLYWLTKNYGEQWEIWRQLSEEWLLAQDSIGKKLDALTLFFDCYLTKSAPWTAQVSSLFDGKIKGWKASSDGLKQAILDNSKRSDNQNLRTLINIIKDFVDWILENHLCEKDDKGQVIKLYRNPFSKVQFRLHQTESVHNPLPYRYICELRNILCPVPNGNFSDWIWAHNQTGNKSSNIDWFDVDEILIDKSDPDCVWRTKQVRRNKKWINIYQIWSPVTSIALLLKLHLPLRTYQVRMLDSGEADNLRYEKGKWIKNTKHSFVLKHHKKGVFRQFKDKATGIESTGLYINTNKTADQNKDEFERGYQIPWQNEEVLYWLEKIRNWQEKYNPITEPTDCRILEFKHLNAVKSKNTLSAMGYCCFLLRDASAKKLEDRCKPLSSSALDVYWYRLLKQLEGNLSDSSNPLYTKIKPCLINEYEEGYKFTRTRTNFPLHSLRVSLITSFMMDAKLPLPIVSKLLAGHSRILMTIYYTKITPTTIKEKMNEAERELEATSENNLRLFLKNAALKNIENRTAYRDDSSIKSALVNRNPLGWENRHYGLCLAGGNNSRTTELKTVAGCWNGGDPVYESDNIASRHHIPVGHGPENCVRCRWFITDARYLPALNAHLNFISYKAHEAANLAVKLESEIEYIEDQKYIAESEGQFFSKYNELQTLHRRYEKQIVEADEFTKDWISTFNLIRRLVEIEQERPVDDQRQKLVSVGTLSDVKVGFTETQSELLHLSLICDDAEIFPDMLDQVRKTSIIQDRTQHLTRYMMRKGYKPLLLMLDKDQQLIFINAIMRQMATQAELGNKLENYQRVTNYFELEHYLSDSNLLDLGMSVLKEKMQKPMNGVVINTLRNKSLLRDLPDEN